MNRTLRSLAVHKTSRTLLSVLFSVLFAAGALAQQTVTGTVTSSEDSQPVPGVNVVIQGSATGTITDANGAYRIEVPGSESVLVFSYIGLTTQEVTVGSQSVIDVAMAADVVGLTEVVVTAFGLEREKKAVTYAAQNVETNEITEARPIAVTEGLSGKVAGLSVARTGAGVGAAPKVILRGNRSISGSSEPIYVVDGVTLNGNVNLGQGSTVQAGGINNISPDDIESITVLKGANAAALYGSRANNGVIVVTTKSGKKGAKNFNVDLNTSFMSQSPIYLNNWQNEYSQGSGGTYLPGANRSWGQRIDGSSVDHWSNDPNWPEPTYNLVANPDNKEKDFFQTGHNFATNLAVSTRGENTNSFISYTFTDAAGIIPNNDLTRHNLSARVTSTFWNKLSVDAKANVIRDEIDNRPATGEGFLNPVRAIYKMPPNIRTQDASRFEFVDPTGVTLQHYWDPGNNAPGNPYWILNRIQNDLLTDRIIGLLSVGYKFTPDLSLRVRSSVDRFNTSRTDRFFTDTYIVADDGRYQVEDQRGSEWNTDFFLNYNKDVNQDWSVDATIGGNLRRNEWRRTTVGGGSRLNVPNLFSIGNTAIVTATEDYQQKEVQSLFGFATIGWKNAVFLDVTGRNDWSSTLTPDNWSFFYPSVGLTAVVSDLVTLPDWWALMKFRANYAVVGNDTDPYQVSRAANVTGGGTGGFLQLSTTIPNANLVPEETTATEIGFDFRFIENRVGLDFTWYKSNSTDQLFPVNVPVGSGASRVFINGADIENTGIEITLSATPVRTGDFTWDLYFNWAKNESTVVEIAPGFDQLNIGGADFMRQFRLIKGQPWGDVYSRGFARDDNGNVIVETDGTPRTTPGLDIPVANFNPDWLGGFGNNLTWKNLNLSFLIDIRQGGSVVSFTNAIMFADGLTEETLNGREGGLVFGDNFFPGETAVQADGSPNTVNATAEAMWSKLGGRNAPVGEAFVLDASNTRLRELTLGYSLPSSVIGSTPFTHVKISLVGRNLFFFSNSAGNVDPEVFQNVNTNADGFESFGLPTVREFGFNLKFGF